MEYEFSGKLYTSYDNKGNAGTNEVLLNRRRLAVWACI
jgi:hypothetical protein